MHRILVTGGAGFIGSNFARYQLKHHADREVVVLDKLTYAGNLDNLRDLESDRRFAFQQGDICDPAAVRAAAAGADAIVNFAAETHVDRSLLDPSAFVMTDVHGVNVLLEAVRELGVARFVQISTDEVYGQVAAGSSKETDRYAPRNPYSATKAAAELMVHAHHESYGVPALITRGSNTFGPFHYPEKMIPLFITNALDDEPLPVYGDGKQVRDWLFVEDHCAGIDFVLEHGLDGEVYNVGGGNERENLGVTRLILGLVGKPESLLRHVEDRAGHDRRYSLDCGKLHRLGWQPARRFEDALAETVQWYRANEWWWRKIKSGAFAEYYQRQYGDRKVLEDTAGD
ncbi:MAG: dTDP-glucose 4,6-dehydratase [Armatimonadetes bacterium CG_4_10_14_3_um_filter_66_18]|nr:dTDP-glucose 4,6-dehydratase [Armatimonadota bacterium]OIP11226.1 MAG: dTDP-glucose 4,6-dehydratase [Armatimonadetes bacterium CG2_30_66_41]PIU89831.1 MAG: dTDP-glucose 4,6-dehydratase [Armatimonadetes bacterium CG06_land_8_20_14_3_00_66_21]PIX49973.1 MAG: dTDP-glucose 4,6-dehydratase [Armatimonadetes bacterium CG_4_8_14_3_um_filter_66_20]PIY53823.1 MAG: dTDP-glucose 4,6-dehydratase [Armatimonadetes bacterium CG_4_10_14_3_um_filter_66_18]PIZ48357.1 MAG: dTDP-glucose 4,6-dehydratase [Armatim